MEIWPIFEEELEKYKENVKKIKHCLFNYENRCEKIIKEIKTTNFDESQYLFDMLYKIQYQLAISKNSYEYPLTERLCDFVYHFDRDDIYSRKFWYEKFKSGQNWPKE